MLSAVYSVLRSCRLRVDIEEKMQADPELANVLAVLQGKAADEVR